MKQMIWPMLLVACGGGEAPVTGKVDLMAFGRTQARLVAVDDQGQRHEAEVRQDGRFEIPLVAGESWALALADDDGVFAPITFKNGAARVSSIRPDDSLDVGAVRPVDDSENRSDDDPHHGRCHHLNDDSIRSRGTVLAEAEVDLAGHRAFDDHPHPEGALGDDDSDFRPNGLDDDRDDDGVCDDDSSVSTALSLPYAVKLAVGETFQLSRAFEGNGTPTNISVEMTGSTWRLTELRADTPFVVEAADCAHEGNRDTGRDRIFVAWTDPTGRRALEHLDLRYCKD